MPDLRAGLPAPARGDEVGLHGDLRAPRGASRRASLCPHDLQARPVYHHKRESIDAHLTIVSAARAVSHWIEHQTGWSIKRYVRTARRYRTISFDTEHSVYTAHFKRR